MKNNKLIFDIDETNHIVFYLSDDIKDMFRYDEVQAVLYQNNKRKFILFEDFLIAGLRDLDGQVKDALNGKLKLDKSFDKNLGYLWNEKLHGLELPQEEDENGNKFWVGYKFILWDSPEFITTWLYEKDDRFWLEITPNYKWHFIDFKKDEKFISYDEFKKNYQSLMLIVVARGTLERWSKQLAAFLSIIQANDNKYIIKKNKS